MLQFLFKKSNFLFGAFLTLLLLLEKHEPLRPLSSIPALLEHTARLHLHTGCLKCALSEARGNICILLCVSSIQHREAQIFVERMNELMNGRQGGIVEEY